MEDMARAGGTRALLERLRPYLKPHALTCTGRTLGEEIAGAEVFDDEVIRPLSSPLQPEGGIAVLQGSLAPRGAILKQSAADPQFLRHTGPAVVFENYDDLKARIDDPDLPVTPDSVLVLRQAGPKGGLGMAEIGMLPIPKKLLQAGVRDMLRISDARMSGGSFGACVVHVSPESHEGGPLAMVQDGDLISIDIDARRLDLLVDDAEMQRRSRAWKAPTLPYSRGWMQLHIAHVLQADDGCDFDFMAGHAPTPEPPIL